MDFELAEAATELDVPLVRKSLATKVDDDVVVEGVLDLAEGRVVELPLQVEENLGAARRSAFPEANLHPLLPPSHPRDAEG
jgi:hypothetical protein